MRRAMPWMVAMVGLGLCALSFWDARAPQSAEVEGADGLVPAHVMHGWGHG